MTDNLRDRLAAVLKAANDRVAGFIGYDEMADAVIAELGLEVTVAARSSDGSFRSFSIEGYWEERVSPHD